ncbi:peptidase inhibitor family I36 protein [Nonomuraea sp. NPDC003560]|uniref:peptidase inhibitor family I36 protein n=1 Tax=Nonomuraea sp. NPDC003560 TaxID=3364341 RepID=UPI0036A01489
MIKAVKGLAIGLPLAMMTLVLTSGTASAARGDCASGYFCAWAGDAWAGLPTARWPRGTNDASWYDNGLHDNAESVYNHSPSYQDPRVPDNVVLFLDVNYGRADLCVLPGEYYDGGMDDNDYDSHRWVSDCA